MSKKTYLILDGNNLAYRANYTMNMSFGGKPAGVVFGLMNMIGGYIGKYRPHKVIVCWDGGRHPERLKMHPEYKGDRVQKLGFDKDNFERQLRYVRKLLFYLGIPQIHQAAREADDFIYAKVRTLSKKENTKVIICSGDKDFRALVTKNVWIHDDKKGLIHSKNFFKTFGLHPHQYVDYLSLMGDKSDNIPGIRGIGEKTAMRILEEYDTLTMYATTGMKDKWFELIQAKIGFSKCLIDLEWFYKRFKLQITEESYYKGTKKPKLNVNKYHEVAMKFGLRKHRKDNYVELFKQLKEN
jgi:DNA polymerase-1